MWCLGFDTRVCGCVLIQNLASLQWEKTWQDYSWGSNCECAKSPAEQFSTCMLKCPFMPEVFSPSLPSFPHQVKSFSTDPSRVSSRVTKQASFFLVYSCTMSLVLLQNIIYSQTQKMSKDVKWSHDGNSLPDEFSSNSRVYLIARRFKARQSDESGVLLHRDLARVTAHIGLFKCCPKRITVVPANWRNY